MNDDLTNLAKTDRELLLITVSAVSGIQGDVKEIKERLSVCENWGVNNKVQHAKWFGRDGAIVAGIAFAVSLVTGGIITFGGGH